jgi:hypothetical protein
MKKFEYDIIEIPNSAVNGIKDFLNGLGAEGLEIIHFTSLSGSIAARLLVKREVEDRGDQVLPVGSAQSASLDNIKARQGAESPFAGKPIDSYPSSVGREL